MLDKEIKFIYLKELLLSAFFRLMRSLRKALIPDLA